MSIKTSVSSRNRTISLPIGAAVSQVDARLCRTTISSAPLSSSTSVYLFLNFTVIIPTAPFRMFGRTMCAVLFRAPSYSRQTPVGRSYHASLLPVKPMTNVSQDDVPKRLVNFPSERVQQEGPLTIKAQFLMNLCDSSTRHAASICRRRVTVI